MLRRVWLQLLTAVMLTGLSAPAFADIKSFNAAVARGDYKAAAADAVKTWPTLDKARADLDIIAGEFAYAALMADDNVAARTFAQANIERQTAKNAPEANKALANELLQLAEHKVAPSAETRQRLYDALSARMEHPGFDRISVVAANTLFNYDSKKGRWTEAHADSVLAVRMLAAAGPSLTPHRRLLEVMEIVSGYLMEDDPERYATLQALQLTVLQDMANAPSPAAADEYTPAYWSAYAWTQSMETRLEGDHKGAAVTKMKKAAKEAEEAALPEAVRRRLSVFKADFERETCTREMLMRPKPNYPPNAVMKRFISTVILQVDIDDQGRAINPKLLASAPEREFGEAVLKSVTGLKFKPGKKWDASKCSLATSNFEIVYYFRF